MRLVRGYVRIIRVPLRISLAGGGTDFPSYYLSHGGAVCSMSINKYIYISVNDVSPYHPNRYKLSYTCDESVECVEQIQHPIIKEVFKYCEVNPGIDLHVAADIPSGTGLGSSSAFTVGLLRAMGKGFLNKLELARISADIEINKLESPIGVQDHYASAIGGCNYLTFTKEGVIADDLYVPQLVRRSMLLFYLGGRRQANTILDKVAKNVENNTYILGIMAKQAEEMSDALVEGKIDDMGRILKAGWEYKKTLSSFISTPEVNKAIDLGIEAGAYGGKLLGAGGTGFILFVADMATHPQIKAALKDYKHIEFGLDTQGVTAIYDER